MPHICGTRGRWVNSVLSGALGGSSTIWFHGKTVEHRIWWSNGISHIHWRWVTCGCTRSFTMTSHGRHGVITGNSTVCSMALQSVTARSLAKVKYIIMFTEEYWVWFNAFMAADAYMGHWTWAPLVQAMACRLFGAKPWSDPTIVYRQLDHEVQNLMKFK